MAEYYPVRVNTFRKNEKVLFDVYISVAGKHLHYIRSHDEFEENRLAKLKQMQIRKLYIPSEQEQAYLSYLEHVLEQLMDPATEVSVGAKIANDALVTAADNAEKNLSTEEGMKQQQRQIGKIAEFIGSDPQVIREIMKEVENEYDDNQHAANVASLCMSVAQLLGMKNGAELSDLSIAALVHDLGKRKLPAAEGKTLTALELRAHVGHGLSLLEGKPFVNARILGLVAAHEELGHGRGYPEKKDTFKLPQVYQILIACNLFDAHQHKAAGTTEEAVASFSAQYKDDFHPKLLAALKKAVG